LREKCNLDIEVYTDAVPISGFYHGGNGPGGYRLTLGRSEEQGLKLALQGLIDIVGRYMEAGQPYYGPPKQIVAKFMAGEKVEPSAWPT